eukprot:CAMPEP_0206529528 /NCGR_PEP_ID=MMETSP0325_2-20121206/2652_1 /ASSEMBLY_ACC=CAM_ASM_000347 /TAXON_ID=2866 /ORGANISM="Crypthecodinium cohnii, Strain Seligo" /LENGTH=119 /DNA_ID=CAMNT_0054025455 /DNA_START=182 /DNA_END=538 /DNA_ORIENTATION=-
MPLGPHTAFCPFHDLILCVCLPGGGKTSSGSPTQQLVSRLVPQLALNVQAADQSTPQIVQFHVFRACMAESFTLTLSFDQGALEPMYRRVGKCLGPFLLHTWLDMANTCRPTRSSPQHG